MLKTTAFNWLLAIVVFFTLAEIGSRLFLPNPPELEQDRRTRIFSYDAELGWFGKKNIRSYYNGSTLISVKSNEDGFRDLPLKRKARKRLLILGDSFVWGVDVQQEQRFSELLKSKFPQWEILNVGISGYGTDQEYLLLQKIFPQYQPDVVFLLFCAENDNDDIKSNARYNGFYKPYFIQEGENLILQGVPVPKSLRFYSTEYPFLFKSRFIGALLKVIFDWLHPQKILPSPLQPLLAEFKKVTEQNGAKFLMGLTLEDHETETILQKLEIPYILLTTPHRFPLYGNHWTPVGHKEVAQKLFPWLAKYIRKNESTH